MRREAERVTGRGRAALLLAVTLLIWTGLSVARFARVGGPLGPVAGAPPLRVALDPSFVPFEFYTGPNTPALGYDVDLAQEIARRLGREAAFLPTSFDALPDELRSGRADVVISAFPFDPRLTEDLAYSGAYFNAGSVLVLRAGQPRPETLGVVAVELGSAADAAARRLQPPPARIMRLPSMDVVAQAVRSGTVDAGLMDMVAALQAGPELQPVGTPVVDELYVVAVRKDNEGLHQALSVIIEALRREGFLDRLAEKWMGRAPPD